MDLNTYEKKQQLIREILLIDSYTDMLVNPYGNYVIQKALSEALDPELTQLLKVRQLLIYLNRK